MSAPVVAADLAALLVAFTDALADFDECPPASAYAPVENTGNALAAWTRANAASLTPEARAACRARTLELIGDMQDKAHGCTPGPYDPGDAVAEEEANEGARACDAARAALLRHLGLTDEPGGGA